jgi:Zn-dependent protease with chaperone function
VNISPEDFIHPADKAALENLQSIPLFTQCSKAFLKTFTEQFFRGLNLAQKVRLGPHQLPKIWAHLPPICGKLGIDVPELYLEMSPAPNAYTFGDTNVFITVTSGLVEYVDEDELHAVLAHECGHIVCRHVIYHTMADMLTKVGGSVFGPLAAVSLPVQLALLYWARRSELSADRAAALVCGSPDPVVHTMIRLAGGPRSITKDVDLELYAQQGAEYSKLLDSLWDKVMQGYAVMEQDHPFTSVRTWEIREWCATERFALMAEKLRKYDAQSSCPVCGGPIQAGWRFCKNCGAQFGAAHA